MSDALIYLLTALCTCATTLGAVWLRHKLTCEDHCKVLEKEMKQNQYFADITHACDKKDLMLQHDAQLP